MGASLGFDAAFRATIYRRFVAGVSLDALVIIAFGSRDILAIATMNAATSTNFRQVPEWRHYRVAVTCRWPMTR